MLPANYVQLLGMCFMMDILDEPRNGDSSMKNVKLLGNNFCFFPCDSQNVEILPFCTIFLFSNTGYFTYDYTVSKTLLYDCFSVSARKRV